MKEGSVLTRPRRPRRRRKTATDHWGQLLIYGDDYCGWARVEPEQLSRRPLEIPSRGEWILPGARVTLLGGSKTSAGYTIVRMVAPAVLIYEGQVGQVVVFRQLPNDWAHYRVVFKVLAAGVLFHFNTCGSGRIVETARSEFSNPVRGMVPGESPGQALIRYPLHETNSDRQFHHG